MHLVLVESQAADRADQNPGCLQPDIICFAKGVTSGYIPLGGLLLADKLLAALDSTEGSTFTTGFTYRCTSPTDWRRCLIYAAAFAFLFSRLRFREAVV